MPSNQAWVAASRAVCSSSNPQSVGCSKPQTWHCTAAVKHPSFVAKLRTDAASQEHYGQNLWPMWLFLS
jgi:hypothetical protein